MEETTNALKAIRDELRICAISVLMAQLRNTQPYEDSTGIQLATAARLLYDKACDAAHFN